MARTRIDLEQLDEFKDFLETAVDNDIPKWNATTKKFEPEPDLTGAGVDDLAFRRVFTHMGG